MTPEFFSWRGELRFFDSEKVADKQKDLCCVVYLNHFFKCNLREKIHPGQFVAVQFVTMTIEIDKEVINIDSFMLIL